MVVAHELERPVTALGWELRGHLAARKAVRLVLSDRCDAILPNTEGQRVIEGRVSKVSATDAFTIVGGVHVPIEEIEALVKPHHSQLEPSQLIYDLQPDDVVSAVAGSRLKP